LFIYALQELCLRLFLALPLFLLYLQAALSAFDFRGLPFPVLVKAVLSLPVQCCLGPLGVLVFTLDILSRIFFSLLYTGTVEVPPPKSRGLE